MTDPDIDPVKPPWYESRQNLIELCHYVADVLNYTGGEVAYVVEKPWKFETEWNDYLAREQAIQQAIDQLAATPEPEAG